MSLHASARQTPATPLLDDLDQGWGLAPEPARSPRPAALTATPARRRPTTAEIDDGWCLPDEAPARARVDVNTATLAELCAVPGIARLRASRIVSARERLGGFASLDDLTRVHGIGPKTVVALRAHLTVAARRRP